ncbi:hypothetical protein M3Y95_00999100 [Aphelenchoides besseyi]|nr:hypothetical protein M3Y95_00999100 [Aphelenchoides besseyi]
MSRTLGFVFLFAIVGMVKSNTWVCNGKYPTRDNCKEQKWTYCMLLLIILLLCVSSSSLASSIGGGGGLFYFLKKRNAAGADLESSEENTKMCDSVELIV